MNNYTPNLIKISAWNANSLQNKINELQHFVITHIIDIMCVNETHARPSDTLKLSNYKQYRTDQLTYRGGGTAIYIKNLHPSSRKPNPSSNKH